MNNTWPKHTGLIQKFDAGLRKRMSVTRALDKTSSLGALIAAMSCAGCFPALASLGTAIGLEFLHPYGRHPY
jgi:hypothetical protein